MAKRTKTQEEKQMIDIIGFGPGNSMNMAACVALAEECYAHLTERWDDPADGYLTRQWKAAARWAEKHEPGHVIADVWYDLAGLVCYKQGDKKAGASADFDTIVRKLNQIERGEI